MSKTKFFGGYLLILNRAVLRKTAACGRFILAFWLTSGYFNVLSNNVNKKTAKKALFLATEHKESY
jgi:hypothetical protein